ncbi:RNA-directed DNA polymerase, eukaryota, reverse transcriptase zinc-binding domain protein [Tanacetum coccineum]
MEKSTINVHGVRTTVSSSFASVLQHKKNKKMVAVSELRNDEQVEGAAVVIPMLAVKSRDIVRSLETIEVEYEWKPPRCSTCCIFDHTNDQCPKLVKEVKAFPVTHVDEEGFVTVNRKKATTSTPSHDVPNSIKQRNGMELKNYFASLGDDKDDMWINALRNSNAALNIINDNDSEDVDEELVVEEDRRNMVTDNKNKGENTPKDSSAVLINDNNLAVCAILESHVASSCLDAVRMQMLWILALFLKVIKLCMPVLDQGGKKGAVLPWCILRDFNAALNLEDTSAGSSFMDISMREFKECVEEIELMDVPCSGLQFTWNQKPQGTNGILKKLDRIMANVEFSTDFVGNYAVFQPYGISDHSPAVLRIPLLTKYSPKLFKFTNVVTTFPRFKEVVNEGWNAQFRGFHMFRVVKKLKSLKKPLRKLLYDKGNLHDNVNKLRIEMERVQTDLDLDPSNHDLRDEEAVYVRAFTEALIMEERFLKQKAKVEWLNVRDFNSAYFHKSVKRRTSRNRIDVVTDLSGDLITGDGVPAAFVSYYEAFLGQQGITSLFDLHNLFFTKLDSDQALDMIKNVTAKEVKEAIFSMGNDKSPGPDGYTACFFKESWDTVASDVTLVSCADGGLDYGVLTLMLRRKVCDSDGFLYHRHCSELEIINLCFANDLFIFAHGDPISAKVIMEAMDEFSNASGLNPSLPKSTTYFCNVLNHIKISILQILPFEEGRLPVKYLGVPLVSSRLVFRDCKELIDRIRSRINDWKNKSLSAAGRLQLIRSVLSSMHVYWASVFILPTRILLDIEQLMRGFLWSHGDMKKGKAKVSWEVVCLSKIEGGLGVRRLDLFNKALMVPHIWNLISRKESLWVKWIHEYKLRGRHFFDVPYRGCMTWGWRKILQLRPLIRDHIRYRIGDGATCSIWFDCWSYSRPLADIISKRDIHRAGFVLSSKVKDVVSNGEWSWPIECTTKYISIIPMGSKSFNCEDRFRMAYKLSFSTTGRAKRRLQTQDLLRPLGSDLPNVIGSISVIVDVLIPIAKRRSVRSVVVKLVVAACSYYIWQERNLRLFKNQKSTQAQVTDRVMSSIKLKLLSCSFKKSNDALLFKRLWELPDSIFCTYHGPFKVLKKVEAVSYKLELPQELSRVHNTFHVSNLKKCYSDDPLVVPLEGLQVDDKLYFFEEPVEIMDREVKQLRRSRVLIVKVLWNSMRGPEFTWEREDQFKKKYLCLFSKTAPSSCAVS